MLILALVLAAVILGLLVRFWVTRDDEIVDLTSPESRQRAAATWLLNGEGPEAEKMLRQAVLALRGWDKALALADFASFLAATGRDAEAGAALQEAVALGNVADDAPAEDLFEMGVQLAQALSRQGMLEEARAILVGSIGDAEGELALGLAEEAYAEFLVRHGELSLALEHYERACVRLAKADHDRAPIAVVRYAHALGLDSQPECWRAMDALSEELKHAVPVALAHLVESFEVDESLVLVDALLARIGTCGHWQEERDILDALRTELSA